MTTQQIPLSFPHQASMREEDFMVAPSNHEAFAWITDHAQWPSHCLTLYGPKGSGKTHLMHIWLARHNGAPIAQDDLLSKDHVTLTSGTKFLAFDQTEQVAGSRASEEALFHLYNHLREIKGGLLLISPRPPAEWGVVLPDLLSRLKASTACEIRAPDDDLLTALFMKHFHDRQLDIGEDVIKFLIARIERSPDAVAHVIEKLDKASLAKHAKITVALAKEILALPSLTLGFD